MHALSQFTLMRNSLFILQPGMSKKSYSYFTLLAPANASKFRLHLPNLNKLYTLNFHVVIVLSDQNYGT